MDGPPSGELMTVQDTPAGLQAREEYAKVISDPKHPHYEGLRRRDPAPEGFVDGLYKKAYPETLPQGTPNAPAPLREPE